MFKALQVWRYLGVSVRDVHKRLSVKGVVKVLSSAKKRKKEKVFLQGRVFFSQIKL